MSRNFQEENSAIGSNRILFELKEDLYRLLVEETTDGLAVISEKGFEYCNPAFLDLLSLTKEKVLSG
ncbi:MAG: PAS domain-containing protein [Candidatus Saccharicenans sp.]